MLVGLILIPVSIPGTPMLLVSSLRALPTRPQLVIFLTKLVKRLVEVTALSALILINITAFSLIRRLPFDKLVGLLDRSQQILLISLTVVSSFFVKAGTWFPLHRLLIISVCHKNI